MIEKLYEQGFLDYTKLILKHYHSLDINEIDAIVLIKILDIYRQSKKVRTSKIISETCLSKKQVEESITHLIEKNIYEIFIEYKNGIGDESVSFNPLFTKLASIFNTEDKDDSNNDVKETIKLIEGELKRPLTPLEFNVISEWYNTDNYTFESIKNAIIESVKSNKVTFKNIERELLAEKKRSLGAPKKLNKKTEEALNTIFKMIE